ncbi:MAG TPA: HAD family hydrolase [Candidatus Saccharimonadales bacterium]
MPRIKAIIYDYDGTLMDTFSVIKDAYDHLSDLYNRPRPDEAYLRELLRHATPMPQIMETLYPGIPQADLFRENAKFFTDRISGVTTFQGVESLLIGVQERGVLQTIVTGGDKNVLSVMEHHDILKFFASVVHCDRVSFGKPHPEGILLALEECGVAPAEAIMVGDSPSDILAGKNAGVAVTVGFTGGHATRADLKAADADHIVDSIAEMDQLLTTFITNQSRVVAP